MIFADVLRRLRAAIVHPSTTLGQRITPVGIDDLRELLRQFDRLDRESRDALSNIGVRWLIHSIDIAPKSELWTRPIRILAHMRGGWVIAQWDEDGFNNTPRPFWHCRELGRTSSRAHQPRYWMDLPPANLITRIPEGK